MAVSVFFFVGKGGSVLIHVLSLGLELGMKFVDLMLINELRFWMTCMIGEFVIGKLYDINTLDKVLVLLGLV